MRIKNKYLRNRLFKIKSRKRAKTIAGGEFSYKSYCPYGRNGVNYYDWIEQLKAHQKSIDDHTRMLCNGKKPWYNSPKWFRKTYTRKERRKIGAVLHSILNGDLELEFPTFKQDANWDWN